MLSFAIAILFAALPASATLNLYNSNSTFRGSTLSTPCRSALIAPINCDPAVQILSDTDFGTTDFLSRICTSACSKALAAYRSAVVSACPSSDSLDISGIKYPTTFPADYVTHYFNATCLMTGSSFCLDNQGAYYNISSDNAGVQQYAALPQEMVQV